MPIKTNRDIRSSLDVARKQKVSSLTSHIEESIKSELEAEYGQILTEEERFEIMVKEKERKEKQDAALRMSRMKMLKVKAKAEEAQRARDELHQGNISDFSLEAEKSKTPEPEISENELSEPKFNKINIGY